MPEPSDNSDTQSAMQNNDAERKRISSAGGVLSYYVAGEGPPLLLVHSLNAAASAYEMWPILLREKSRHRVYAIDLPGFGHSERSSRNYNVNLYVQAIDDLLSLIASTSTAPISAMALSLGCEFLAMTETQNPGRLGAITFITPTGFSRRALQPGPPGTLEMPGATKLLNHTPIGPMFFALLSRRFVIEYFLRRTWGGNGVSEDLIDAAFETAQQPGAYRAPCAFLSGKLFTRAISQVYQALSPRLLITTATRGDFSDPVSAAQLEPKSNVTIEVIEGGAMPHFENPQDFFSSYDRFRDVSPEDPVRRPAPQLSTEAFNS